MTTESKAFFDKTVHEVTPGNIVYASDLNNPLAAIETGQTALLNALQTGATIFTATDVGSTNAYAINPAVSLTEYSDGQMVWLKPGSTNTGPSTINVSSLGAKAIRTTVSTALVGGELIAGHWHMLKYSSTLDAFVVVSERGNAEITTDKTVIGGTGTTVESTETTIAVSIATGGVDTTQLADGAVTADKLDPGAIPASVPAGTVIAFPVATPPTGYLECDGSSISRTTYAALFAVISDDYGTADGASFNLPDYRGRFLRGWAHGQTTDPDRASRTDRGDGTTGDYVGTKQADEFESHDHDYYQSLSNQTSSGTGVYAGRTTGTTFSNPGGNETRPININVMFCVKY